ncbi:MULTISPECIES: CNNM family magnesium/cobalt transport protein CorC [unclassified Agarivorans]|uniref:CNNM family magnesium/cobalt transport protein CorC n=1 Tax=unclassified Agarivorans TaxID=2636026 RepID=UPI0010D065EA|nr:MULTISPECIES: CNNM family magnesium/cobalt transport protein CorC [unclassified Agarivorans]MDO6687618.1 CNNM family magnesium/cobalt transport protein CorC [Agarivorans sp. 3_MG-2023]MDO6717172.1 CNNM family magnesium/cobalt transport protein CorC [Agarivorans sp. 2_MG-2023]MDO6765838.1 CNNM family magnesium/cobalt transport protein CorC [Agarivorans sp. 1_MG-2023]GDY24339.1 cobalt transporter [Agarivorans sp. Toyoura001]
MSDDNPHSSSGSTKKGWIERIIQLVQGEPKSKEELVEVIQDANQRELIDQNTREMIEGVLDVSSQRVRDIMIPRSQMVTLDVNQTIAESLPTLTEARHSRFPVINEDKDHIEGVLLAKDLLKFAFTEEASTTPLSEVIRPAVVVPESKRIDKLLKEFRSERYHMAIVVDEFGGVSGLVTIEDILELIVGDIEDEFANEEDLQDDIRRINDKTFAVNALTDIEDFNQYFGCEFSDEEVDTVGGLVTHAFGHLPGRGEKIEIEGYHFKVRTADRRRVVQLQVSIPEEKALQLSIQE